MRRASRLAGAVAPALVAGLIIAACGSSASSSEDFVADADAICTEAARGAVNAYVGSLVEEGEAAATLAYAGSLLEVRTAELEQLEELGAPEGQSEAVDQYLEARRLAVDRLGGAVDAAEAEDPQAFEAERDAAEAERLDADALGAELGLAACANQLPEEQAAEVESVLEETATSEDAERVCGELATTRFQDQFGGLESCVEAQNRSEKAKGANVDDVRGVDEVSAVATVELQGRDDALDTFEVNLTYVEGTWRVETIVPIP